MLSYDKKEPAKRFTLLLVTKGKCRFQPLSVQTACGAVAKKEEAEGFYLYFGFATSLPRSLAIKLPSFITEEYRRKWL